MKNAMAPRVLGDCDLGRILTVLRAARGWNQQDLSRAAKVQQSSLCYYERGERVPGIEVLTRLLDALGFPFAALDQTRSYLAELDARLRSGAAAAPSGGNDLAAEIRVLSAELGRLGERLSRLAGSLPGGKESPAEFRPPEARPEKEQTEELWAELMRHGHARQQELVRENPAFRSRGLCERLCLESAKQAAGRPRKALLLAQLALGVADRIDREEGRGTHLRALAGAHLANALRAGGSLPAAEALFAEARRLWNEAGREGEALPTHEARILDLESSLRRAQRRLPEAVGLIDRALAVDPDPAMRGRLLINKSKIVEEQGDLAQAIALLQHAEPLVDPAQELRLVLCLRHNLAWLLATAGRAGEAEALLPAVRKLARKLNNELDLVRQRWLEARVEAGLGRTERAIALLNGVRGDFATRGIDYDTALVTLELAVLLAGEGRTAEVKSLARHLVPLFEAQKVHREALAALALFRQAAERERVTAELARDLLEFLLRARHDPALRFEALAGVARSA